MFYFAKKKPIQTIESAHVLEQIKIMNIKSKLLLDVRCIEYN